MEKPERLAEFVWMTIIGMSFLGYTAYRIWNDKGWPSIPYFSYFFVWVSITAGWSVIFKLLEIINLWTILLSGLIGLLVMAKCGNKFRTWYRSEFAVNVKNESND